MRLYLFVGSLTAYLFVAGCGTTPEAAGAKKPPGTITYTSDMRRPEKIQVPDEKQLQQWYLTAKGRVEAETDTDLSPVYLKKMLPPEMQQANEEALAYLYRNNPSRLAIMRSVVRKSGKPQYRSVVALFNPALNAIVLSDSAMAGFFKTARANNVSDEEAFTVLMIHELVHAADRARFSEGAYADPTRLMSLGVRAIIEGHAQYLTGVICKREGCLRGYRLLRDDVVSGIGTEAFLSNPQAQFSAGVSEFMYFYGERFFTRLGDNPKLIEQALRDPPVDPVQIRYPEQFPDRARIKRSEKLASIFKASRAPWKYEDAVVYRNHAYLPTATYPKNRVLAQETFDVYESASPENNTNVGLHWYVNDSRASKFFHTLSAKPKYSRNARNLYSSKLLNRKSSKFQTASIHGKTQSGRLTVMAQQIIPTKDGVSNGISPIRLTNTIGQQGQFVVQITQRTGSGAPADMSSYVISLLESLVQQ